MKTIKLAHRPSGKPNLQDFKIIEEDKPEIQEDEILLRALYISVDPYLRGRMRDEKSYIPAFQINEPLESMMVAEVMESKNSHFSKGEFVAGMMQWKEFQTSKGNGLNKVSKNTAPLSAFLGILGLTGLTAYLGLEKIGNLKEGETLLVSGAAGAVGSIVGQIGKLKGCKVIGIAGSDEKIKTIKDKFDFDEGINYKKEKDMKKAIENSCPNGVDVYFDNVGGSILDATIQNMKKDGRVINCGAISIYNETELPTGLRLESFIIKNSLLLKGFIVRDYVKDFGPATKQLATWLKEGKLTYNETVVGGFENAPQAFIDLFDGKNNGKMVVEV